MKKSKGNLKKEKAISIYCGRNKLSHQHMPSGVSDTLLQ